MRFQKSCFVDEFMWEFMFSCAPRLLYESPGGNLVDGLPPAAHEESAKVEDACEGEISMPPSAQSRKAPV